MHCISFVIFMGIRLFSYFWLIKVFFNASIPPSFIVFPLPFNATRCSLTPANRPSTHSNRHLNPLRHPLTLTRPLFVSPPSQFRAYHYHFYTFSSSFNGSLSRFSTASSFFSASALPFNVSLSPCIASRSPFNASVMLFDAFSLPFNASFLPFNEPRYT